MSNSCEKCKGLCCRYFCFEIDEPDDYEEFEDIRWYLFHEGVSVHIDEDGDWYIQIDNRCKALGEDYRCTAYENRPLICRSYSTGNCEITDDDYGYQEEFHLPEDIEAYARKTLGEETFEREMVKHRAKAHGVSKQDMHKHLWNLGLLRGTWETHGKKTNPPKRRSKKRK